MDINEAKSAIAEAGEEHEIVLDYACGNRKETFTGMVKTIMADSKHSSEIHCAHCNQDHSSDTIFYQISKKIFKMMTRNYGSQLNDAVRQMK